MDFVNYRKTFENCECGKAHGCPIDVIEIGNKALEKIVNICENYSNIVLVSDQNTYRVCGEKVYNLLQDKVYENLIFNSGEGVLIPNEEAIEKIKNSLNSNTDLIIGVGSGVINDLCKYVSFFTNYLVL